MLVDARSTTITMEPIAMRAVANNNTRTVIVVAITTSINLVSTMMNNTGVVGHTKKRHLTAAQGAEKVDTSNAEATTMTATVAAILSKSAILVVVVNGVEAVAVAIRTEVKLK